MPGAAKAPLDGDASGRDAASMAPQLPPEPPPLLDVLADGVQAGEDHGRVQVDVGGSCNHDGVRRPSSIAESDVSNLITAFEGTLPVVDIDPGNLVGEGHSSGWSSIPNLPTEATGAGGLPPLQPLRREGTAATALGARRKSKDSSQSWRLAATTQPTGELSVFSLSLSSVPVVSSSTLDVQPHSMRACHSDMQAVTSDESCMEVCHAKSAPPAGSNAVHRLADQLQLPVMKEGACDGGDGDREDARCNSRPSPSSQQADQSPASPLPLHSPTASRQAALAPGGPAFGDLTVGSLPSMLEEHEYLDLDDDDQEDRRWRPQLSKCDSADESGRLDSEPRATGLASAVVKAASRAAREAVHEQFLALRPILIQAVADAISEKERVDGPESMSGDNSASRRARRRSSTTPSPMRNDGARHSGFGEHRGSSSGVQPLDQATSPQLLRIQSKTFDALPGTRELAFGHMRTAIRPSSANSEDSDKSSVNTARFMHHHSKDVKMLESEMADVILMQSGLSIGIAGAPSPSRQTLQGQAWQSHTSRGGSSMMRSSSCRAKESAVVPQPDSGMPSPRCTSPQNDSDVASELSAMARTSRSSGKSLAPMNPHEVVQVLTRRASHPAITPMTSSEMLHNRVQELTDDVAQACPMSSSESSWTTDHGQAVCRAKSADLRGLGVEPTVFRLCGLLPWSESRVSRSYQAAAFMVAVIIIGCNLYDIFLSRAGVWSVEPSCTRPSPTCWQQRGLLSGLPLALGIAASVALIVGRAISGRDAGVGTVKSMLDLLQVYMIQHDLVVRFRRQAARDARSTILMWMITILVAGVAAVQDLRQPGYDEISGMAGLLFFCGISVVTTCAASVTHLMLYICRALSVMVDGFCCTVADSPDISYAMQHWNVLQAMLLKASFVVEWVFISLMVAIAFAVPLLLADFITLGSDFTALPAMLPGMLVTLVLVRVFFVAAAITDKCARVPAVVNSLSFGDATENRRQLLIDYIVGSAAGFYVCDMRLTMGMALKFMYMWSVVAFGLATNVITSST